MPYTKTPLSVECSKDRIAEKFEQICCLDALYHIFLPRGIERAGKGMLEGNLLERRCDHEREEGISVRFRQPERPEEGAAEVLRFHQVRQQLNRACVQPRGNSKVSFPWAFLRPDFALSLAKSPLGKVGTGGNLPGQQMQSQKLFFETCTFAYTKPRFFAY